MVQIALYFQIHIPYRLKNFRVFDVGRNEQYFDEEKIKAIVLKLAKESYLQTNKVLSNLIEKHDKKIKITISISGTTIELLEKYAPQVIEDLKKLTKTGCIEFLAETYYHSLSFLYSKEEFRRQIELHREAIIKHFEYEPKVFRNTELLYNNELATFIENLGYTGIISEGNSQSIGYKNPNHIYLAQNSKDKISIIFKNSALSEDISIRYSDKSWEHWPLNGEKYSNWIDNLNNDGEIVNIFLDYEIFNENSKNKGITNFLREFIENTIENTDNIFTTPSHAIKTLKKKERLDIPFLISATNSYNNLDLWIGNKMQKSAIDEIYLLEKIVKESKNKEIIQNWRKLTTSDHFYNMSTTYIDKKENYQKAQHIENPYDAYIFYMNILNDIIIKTKIQEKNLFIQKEIMAGKEEKNKNILNRIKIAIKR